MNLSDSSVSLILCTWYFRSRDRWGSGSDRNQREMVFSVAFVVTSLLEQSRANGLSYFFEKDINSNFIKSNLEPTCARHCPRILSFLEGSSLEAYSQVKV